MYWNVPAIDSACQPVQPSDEPNDALPYETASCCIVITFFCRVTGAQSHALTYIRTLKILLAYISNFQLQRFPRRWCGTNIWLGMLPMRLSRTGVAFRCIVPDVYRYCRFHFCSKRYSSCYCCCCALYFHWYWYLATPKNFVRCCFCCCMLWWLKKLSELQLLNDEWLREKKSITPIHSGQKRNRLKYNWLNLKLVKYIWPDGNEQCDFILLPLHATLEELISNYTFLRRDPALLPSRPTDRRAPLRNSG